MKLACLLVLLLLVWVHSQPPRSVRSNETSLTVAELVALRNGAKDAFLHSYDSYMAHGFPFDEVMPISCGARKWQNRDRGTLDDAFGGYMLTLVDSLDTLLVMKEYDRYLLGLAKLRHLSFERDTEVSVFESSIRVLGGLLSAHQLTAELLRGEYDGFLLDKAVLLADKLLPAFATATGIPIHKVNLLKGVSQAEQRHTCTAAGGSYLLEFSLLSRLTGDPVYEQAAKKATDALWGRRSKLNLVGSLIHTGTGRWLNENSGFGAGIDSFFETLLKTAILLNDQGLMKTFEESYRAIMYHTLLEEGLHVDVDMHKGNRKATSSIISGLSGFWPALQVLAGDTLSAKATFGFFHSIWSKFGALPDVFDLETNSVRDYSLDSPNRPELLESAYHLYTATKDDKYIFFGRDVLTHLNTRLKVKCGYASLGDVVTGRLDDRMDSFFLAETLKYLYLLFDEGLPAELRTSLFCNSDSGHSRAGTPINGLINKNTSAAENGRLLSENGRDFDGFCVNPLSVIFSTEGHVFQVQQDFRPQGQPQGPPIPLYYCPLVT